MGAMFLVLFLLGWVSKMQKKYLVGTPGESMIYHQKFACNLKITGFNYSIVLFI